MPIYTNFEGEAHAKKTRFFGQISQVPKMPFSASFFFKLSPAEPRIKLDQNRVVILICESSENQFGRTKKMLIDSETMTCGRVFSAIFGTFINSH